MKTNKAFSACVIGQISIASLIVCLTACGRNDIVSSMVTASFVLLFIFFATITRRFPGYAFLIVLLCISHVLINGLTYGAVLNFEYMKKMIMFLAFVLLVNCCTIYGDSVSDITVRLVEFLPVFAGTILVVSFFYLGNTKIMAGAIVLGFTNPNFAGMWLFHLIIYGVLFVIKFPENRMRLLFTPIIGLMVYLLFLTDTRSALIACLFWAAMLLLRAFHLKLRKWFFFIVVAAPLIYAFFYLGVVETEWFQNFFAFAKGEGKTLTSRVTIWHFALENILKRPIIGSYAEISYGTGQSQMHNTHIDILCSYGLLPLLLFIINFYSNIVKTYKKTHSFYQYAALSGFCAVIILGAFEAAVVSGAMGLNLLTAGLIVLATWEK